jgi:alkanesulfonate monooxygenase SsuD/methylene tetrahydromethanopterin reductase-like flavin-dependent oxidoreductase (luciferase family)
MRFGILSTPVHSAGSPPELQLAEHRELIALAEQLGFDAIVAGQHFLGSELRYYQPVPYLLYLSRSAPTMRLVTGVLLLSLVNPVEVAESVATLDALSDGRAVLGVGLGYSDHEFAAFGIDRRHRVARFEEGLEVVKALWSGEEVVHHGRHVRLDGVRPAVRPVQSPRPPIWIAGQTEPAVRRAARLGDAWYAPPFPSHAGLRELADVFAAEREASGLPKAEQFPVRRELLIADGREAALREATARSATRYETYVKWGIGGDLDRSSGAFGTSAEAHVREHFILGDAADCAEQLARLRDEVGMTDFMFKPQWPGLEHREAMRQLELFGTKVIPSLGSAVPAGAPAAGAVEDGPERSRDEFG